MKVYFSHGKESGPWGWVLVAVILVSSLMAVVYIWRIVEALYFGVSVEGDSPASEAPLQLLLVTWLVALLNIVFGLFPGIPLELANSSTAILLIGGAPCSIRVSPLPKVRHS